LPFSTWKLTIKPQAEFRISGEFEMKLYSVIKRRGQWAVCSQEVIVLQFETYDEAIGTAQSAAKILSCKDSMRQSYLREWAAELGDADIRDLNPRIIRKVNPDALKYNGRAAV
jgi:hypothetical protein